MFLLAPITAALAGLCVWPALPLFAQATNETTPQVLKPVIVTGKRPSLHDVESEADLVGPANQPEWTTRRAFSETDVNVIRIHAKAKQEICLNRSSSLACRGARSSTWSSITASKTENSSTIPP